MATRVGINGFGRIGRGVFRILSDRNDISVVAINDLFENAQLAYLLKYDTVMGIFDKELRIDGDTMIVEGSKIAMTAQSDPAEIPWKAGTAGGPPRFWHVSIIWHTSAGLFGSHADPHGRGRSSGVPVYSVETAQKRQSASDVHVWCGDRYSFSLSRVFILKREERGVTLVSEHPRDTNDAGRSL